MKRFYVRHDKSSMPVGTDGVLLGAWCPLAAGSVSDGRESDERLTMCGRELAAGRPFRVLDAGTGCGLIALMVAQRIDAAMGEQGDWQVDAIDIDAASAHQAAENFAASPWNEHLRAVQADLCEWQGTYDLIVSNPPFFNRSLMCPDPQRSQARHAGAGMTYDDLTCCASRLTGQEGRLAIILPTGTEKEMLQSAEKQGLYVQSRCYVSSKQGTNPNRVMLYMGKEQGVIEETHLVLSTPDSPRSETYARLTADFYL